MPGRKAGVNYTDWKTVEGVLDFLFDRDPDLFFWQEYQQAHGQTREEAEARFRSWCSGTVREFTNGIRPARLRNSLAREFDFHSPDKDRPTFPLEVQDLESDSLSGTASYHILNTGYGPAIMFGTEEALIQIEFLDSLPPEELISSFSKEFPNVSVVDRIQPHFLAAQEYINANGHLPSGDTPIPIRLIGTAFQKAIWTDLLTIPAGALASYGDLAATHGGKWKARAVGGAVGANRLAGVVPCHRVIGREGTIGHFRWGSTRKKAMIGREQLLFSQ